MAEATDANLIATLGAWFDAFRTGSTDSLFEIMDESIVWEGRMPGTKCRGRKKALGFLERSVKDPPCLRRLEASQDGDTVTLIAEGPDFADPQPDGSFSPIDKVGLVFTFKDGKVCHMQGTYG